MKRIIISVLFIFGISFLYHSVYDIFPNYLTSLFFPVNESVWEHNKMIFMAYITWMIVLFVFNRGDEKSIIFSTLISSLISIILTTTIFMPIYLYVLNLEHNIFVTLIIYLFSIVVAQIIAEIILRMSYNKNREFVSLLLIGVTLVIFIYFTYYPLKVGVMYDYSENDYGIMTSVNI